MTRLETPPGFFANLFTIGIARARWVASANRTLAQGGAGFWFAWLLLPFANYGLAGRLNVALRQAGSSHHVSPLLCFFLTGWPFIGATRRFKRGTAAYNDAVNVRAHAVSGAAHASVSTPMPGLTDVTPAPTVSSGVIQPEVASEATTA